MPNEKLRRFAKETNMCVLAGRKKDEENKKEYCEVSRKLIFKTSRKIYGQIIQTKIIIVCRNM